MLTYEGIIIDATKGQGGISDDFKDKEKSRKHDKYEADIMDLMPIIETRIIGHTVRSWISKSNKTLTIQPSYGGLCPDGTTADTPEDAYPEDDKVLTENQKTGKISKSSQNGTGQGSNVEAYFTAENYMLNDKGWNQCFGGHYGSQPDEALFHELVHALRQMYGLYYPFPTMGSLVDYGDEEEFFAIVATNVYISAKNKNDQLRASHNGFEPLAAPLNTSSGFVDDSDNRQLLQRQCFANKVLWFELAVSNAQFNPFRELKSRFDNGKL
ncbi:MAG: hypothetical protein ACJ8FY_03925 [Gemmataceae bacterium]